MANKKFILNADDFGMSKYHNKAVLEGYNSGFLTSASLCANGVAFNAAVYDIIPECENLGIGAHLNIIEGESITNPSLLTNKKGEFNKGFLQLLLLSYNKEFLQQVEDEFRAQIEKILVHTQIHHLDSHVHVHAIPKIFEIVCKLAQEYGIKQVRTQREKFYLIPSLVKHLKFSYPINLVKVLILYLFSQQNMKTVKDYNLITNDYIVGVGYTGMMDADAIEYGLKCHKNDAVVEALIHPCFYKKMRKNNHFTEFQITQNKDLLNKIHHMGFEPANYKPEKVYN